MYLSSIYEQFRNPTFYISISNIFDHLKVLKNLKNIGKLCFAAKNRVPAIYSIF